MTFFLRTSRLAFTPLLRNPIIAPKSSQFQFKAPSIARLTPIYTQKMSLMTINESVRDVLKKHQIIGDVVDDFTPTVLVTAKYPSGVNVSLGNTLQPSHTQETPRVQIQGVNDSDVYTLILTDPDAPSREDPKWSEFCHWIVTGVEGSVSKGESSYTEANVDLSKGKTLIEYMGPAPPAKTGKHRYVLLVYKNGSSTPSEGPKERKLWGNEKPRTGAKKWADKNGLELVGANFFFAENSEQ